MIRLFLFFLIVLQSCSVRMSYTNVEKFNKFNEQYLDYYTNDSLGLAIDFYGGHRVKKWKFDTDSISKSTKKLLKNTVHSRKVNVLFTTASVNPYFGLQYFGVLLQKNSLIHSDTSSGGFTSNWGCQIYSNCKTILQKPDILHVVYLIPISNFYVAVVATKKLFKNNSFADDSIILQRNSYQEMKTVISGIKYDTLKATSSKISSEINGVLSMHNYFQPIESYNLINVDLVEKSSLQSFYHQTGITLHANISDLDEVRHSYDYYINSLQRSKSGWGNDTGQSKTISDTLVYNPDWQSKVLELAKAVNVIFINESHYDWRNRFFLETLLPKLKTIGYNHLALEDFNNTSNAVTFSIPDKTLGYYIKEPQMANLYRTALSLKISIHAYEDTIVNQEEEKVFGSRLRITKRENNEGMNLYNLYRKDSFSKWIVYCGYSHSNKVFFSDTIHSAYWHFKQLAKVPCGSINQTDYSDLLNRKIRLNNLPIGYYAVQNVGSENNHSDIYITNNISKKLYEIPSSQLMICQIPSQFLEFLKKYNQRIWLSVYLKDELDTKKVNSIPIFIKDLSLISGELLYFPKGKYTMVLYDGKDTELLREDISL